jgi:HEAT repeat protein
MMNKFNGPEDPDYQCVVGKIEEILRDIRTNSPLNDADAWIRNKHYAVDRLKIERLSGDLLPMDQCYVNLAIVEQRGQDSDRLMTEDADADADGLTKMSSPFSIFNRQKIETPDTTVQVELATIFNECQQRNGVMIQPRRILIRGRAGVGKTTLCKKIVFEFTQGTWSGWNDLFDRILWVPLRNLKLEERRQHPAYDFEALFTHEYFSLPNNQPHLARQLARSLETSSSRTLFLLDGLDEVSQELAGSNSMSRFLNELLEQPNIIVTCRPSGRLPLSLDLELEALGFYPDQVNNYIEKAFINPKTAEMDEKTIDKVQSFLEKHWLIQGLVRIPIQLDALCYSWNDIRSDMPETMTALYQAIELSLWKKDIVRLEKKHNDRLVTPYHIQDAGQQKMEEFVRDEISFIEGLAFAGLLSDTIEFEPKHLNLISDRFPGFLLDKAVSSLSFLRTSSPSSEYRDRSYHFIHLTFQEYFAARYFVRQWTARKHLSYVELGNRKINKIEPAKFLQKHKYTARYDILWRFVAGLLDAEPEEIPLFLQIIEEEPLDLLGPAHQRLVMHCLSEATSNILIRTDLEQRLSKWLLFECEIKEDVCSCLASEIEFPEQALDAAFREGSDNAKRMILSSIAKRATVPAIIIKQAISWLGHVDWSTQEAAIAALQRLVLSNKILRIITARLEDKDLFVRRATIRALGQQSVLPKEISEKEIVEAIAARLEDEDDWVRRIAVEVLGHQSVLPGEILKAVAARLEDEDRHVRHATTYTLGRRLALPGEILKAVAARLEDEDESVREATVWALGLQLTLPDEILEATAARLEDERPSVRAASVRALGKQSTLPNEILEAVAARLGDEDESAREAAVEVLCQQFVLPDGVLDAIAALFENEDWPARQAAENGLNHMKLKRLGLPCKRLEDIAARLETKNRSIRQAALRSLDQHFSLSDEALEAIAAQLQDNDNSSIHVAAIMALGNQSNLPNEIIQAIARQLKDNEDTSVQRAAIEALGSQSNLSSEILQVIAASFEDKKYSAIEVPAATEFHDLVAIVEIQEASITALGKQPDLPKKMLHALAAQLENNWPQKRLVAVKALGNQPNLPEEIFNAIAAQLKHSNSSIQMAVIEVLRTRPGLSNKILKTLATLLESYDETYDDWYDDERAVQRAAIEVLGDQPSLPNEFLNAIAVQLNNDALPAEFAERTLRKFKEFYLKLFEGPYARYLYRVLLQQSFTEDLIWCVDDDGNSVINIPGDGWRMVIGKQDDMKAMMKEIRPANYPA